MNLKNMIVERHYTTNFKKLVSTTSRRFDGNKSLAEEAVQEAYAKVLNDFESFNMEKYNFNLWFKLKLNDAVSKLKDQERCRGVVKRAEEEDKIEEVVEDEHHEEKLLCGEMLEKIKGEIASVRNETHRQLLTLHFLDGLTLVEIGSCVDVTYDAINNTIKRFRNRLKFKFGENNGTSC